MDKDGKEEARQYTEFDLADKLRQRGWVLPAYTMAPDARQVFVGLTSLVFTVLDLGQGLRLCFVLIVVNSKPTEVMWVTC